MSLRRLISWALLLALAGTWAWIEIRPDPVIRAANGAAVHVIDGDSLRIGEVEIRIAGIDAPEYRQVCRTAGGERWPCGRTARDALVKLAMGPGLACTARDTDRYRRTLADCRTGAGDIAETLALAGLALDARDPRFDSHAAAIAQARAARRGLWQGDHQHPADWRKRHLPATFED